MPLMRAEQAFEWGFQVVLECHTPELWYTASAIVPCSTLLSMASLNAVSSAALAFLKPGKRNPGRGLAAACNSIQLSLPLQHC